jgi:hypothetical protein
MQESLVRLSEGRKPPFSFQGVVELLSASVPYAEAILTQISTVKEMALLFQRQNKTC